MDINDRTPRPRQGIALAVLAAAVVLGAACLTQCRPIDDRVTGVNDRSNVQFAPGPFPRCIHACNDARKACHDAEEALFRINERACSILPRLQAKRCLAAEKARHKAALDACVRASQACKKRCPKP